MKNALRLLPIIASATVLSHQPVASVPVQPTRRVNATVATSKAPYRVVKKIPLAGADGWDYLFLDAGARRLYVPRFTHVSVLNVDSGKIIGDLPNLPGVHGVAIDAKHNRGFTSNGRSNSVSIFNLKTLKILGETPVGEGPDSILFDAAPNRVFTFNGQAQTATALDAATGKVVGTIALPGRPEFAVADNRGEIFDNIEDKSEIVAINARTLKIDHVWPIAPGEEPSGLAIDAARHRVFAVCSNKKLIVLNTDSGAVTANLPIGSGPDACLYDAQTHLIFSPNGQDGTLTVIRQSDANSYQVAQTGATQAGARTMALDAKTHHVFTVAGQRLPPIPGDANPRHRGYVEGTVSVLELAPTP